MGVLRCPVVVGRTAELDRVDALLRSVRTGVGGTLGVLGEPGIGKTRLTAEVARRAGGMGMVVLAGRTSNAPGAAGLRPMFEVAAAASLRWPVLDDSLAAYRSVLSRLCPAWGEPAPGEVPTVVLADALLRLLGSDPQGCVVILEDLHWADPDTLQVVEYLADHAPAYRVGVVMTARLDPPAARDLVSALEARDRAETLTLDRLTESQVAEFAKSSLGDVRLGPGVAELVAPAAGLPLLVEDLLGDARTNGLLTRDDGLWQCAGSPDAPPPSFVASVLARLEPLGDHGKQMLGSASVLGVAFEAAWVSEMIEIPITDVEGVIAGGVAAQLLDLDPGSDRYEFRHALTREAVLRSLPPERRREYAAAGARLARRLGMASDRIAELEVTAGRADEAAQLLLDAARAERETGTRDSALRMLARAHDLAAEPSLSRLVTVAYLSGLAEVGRADEARTLAAGVLPFLPTGDAAQVRLTLASASLSAENVDEARSQVDLAVAGAALTEEQWARVWALRAGIALGSAEPGRVVEAEHLAHRAVAAARATTSPQAICDALLVLGRCARLRDLAAAEDAFTQARDEADAGGLTLERLNALAELGTIQMLREVRADTLQAAYDAAVALGALVTAAGIGVNLAGLGLMRGEVADAISTAQRTQEAARRYGLSGALPILLVFEGIGRGFQGATPEMERLLGEAEAMAPDSPDVLAAAWAIGRATVAFLDEDRDRARRALHRADAILRSSPALMIDPAAGPLLLLSCLDRPMDRHEIDAAEQRSGTGSAWTSMWIDAARAIHAGATGEDPFPHHSAALASARRYPVFGLVAQRLTAEAAVGDGWGDPAAWLTDLELRATDLGYPQVASACRALARRTGATVPRRRAVDAALPEALRTMGVTAREAEVLALMPQRLTNAQIAERLFLSPRTVEKHVASLLTKTGAGDRASLAFVAEDPAGAPAHQRTSPNEAG